MRTLCSWFVAVLQLSSKDIPLWNTLDWVNQQGFFVFIFLILWFNKEMTVLLKTLVKLCLESALSEATFQKLLNGNQTALSQALLKKIWVALEI